jgi:hypothetical protein
VEIILNVREKMDAMQKQIQGFVETLNKELSQRAARRPVENNSSMPVIHIDAVTTTRPEGEAARSQEKSKMRFTLSLCRGSIN